MRLSPEATVIQRARQLLYEAAMVHHEGRPIGTVAAIPRRKLLAPNQIGPIEADLNYNEIFVRDNVPVMIYLLLDGRGEVVRTFLDICLDLQSTDPGTEGIFPNSFIVDGGRPVADYGQRAIGRVSGVDATLWWPILAHMYVQRSGDVAWAQRLQVQIGLQRFLKLILHPWFRDAPTLFVPDGSFMVDRPLDVWGSPLEIQVLLYGALRSTARLIQLGLASARDPFAQEQHYQQTLAKLKLLRRYLLRHYWTNPQTIQVLRRRPTEQYGEEVLNEFNIQTETIPHWLQDWLGSQGGYLIGNIRTGRPDFRFFSLGNCLGAIFDVITRPQQRSLFQLFLRNRSDLIGEMPLRISHPPLDAQDWRNKTGYDPKNRPWCYHNGGHWPCLLWSLVVAVQRHQQQRPESLARHRHTYTAIQDLLSEAYELMLRRLPQQKWAEYFDGPTGVWIGQQARIYQTWSIAGLLVVHHLLRVNPADASILDLAPLPLSVSSKADLPAA